MICRQATLFDSIELVFHLQVTLWLVFAALVILMAASYSIIAEDEHAILDAYLGGKPATEIDGPSVAVEVHLTEQQGDMRPLLTVDQGSVESASMDPSVRTPSGTPITYLSTLPRYARDPMSAGRLTSGSLDLDRFAFFAASSYVFVHAALNIFVMAIISLVLTVVLFGAFELYLFSPGYVFGLIFVGLLNSLVGVARSCVNALQRTCWHYSRSFTIILFCGGFFETHFRHRFIVFGRLTLMFDVAYGVFIGPILGGVQGVVRGIMGIIWGLFRVALLAQPVLPPVLAGFDSAFNTYGAVMKARHAALLDPEYPPSLY